MVTFGNRLHHWNLKGRLVASVEAENYIGGSVFTGTLYCLSMSRTYRGANQNVSLEFYSALYDSQGHLLGTDQSSSPSFIEIQGSFFGPIDVFTHKRVRDPDYRPFLVRQIAIENPSHGRGLEPLELCFFRLPALVRAFKMNYKGVFLAVDRPWDQGPSRYLDKGGAFILVYQLEARAWKYDKAAIARELKNPAATVSAVDLKLPGFVPTNGKTFTIDRPMRYEEFSQRSVETLQQWSLVLWFGNLGDAYGIAYTIPSGGKAKIRLAALNKDLIVTRHEDVPLTHRVIGGFGKELMTLTAKQEKDGIVFLLDRFPLGR